MHIHTEDPIGYKINKCRMSDSLKLRVSTLQPGAFQYA